MNRPFQRLVRAAIAICLFVGALQPESFGAVSRKFTRPVIGAFAPGGGVPGTLVTILGANLSSVTEVRFGGVNAVFIPISSTALAATVPLNAISGPISVSTSVGFASTTAWFVVAPRITGFSPANASPGMVVTIEGANFGRALSVSFGGVNAVSFDVTAETQIHAVVPAGAQSGPIRVTTSIATAVSAGSLLVTGAEPVINDFFPTNGVPGSIVTINGRAFENAASVKFGGINAASFSVTAPTQITAVVPANAQSGPITVVTPGGTGVSAQLFVAANTPLITGFEPASGPPGTIVVIDGLNFADATKVLFNDVPASFFSITSPTQIRAEVAGAATAGLIRVVGPSGTGESEVPFNVTRIPVVTELAPQSGSPGTLVTIDGINFDGVTEVAFGTLSAVFSRVAPTQIVATVPKGAGTGLIQITNPFGSGTSPDVFLVTAGLPEIENFSPPSGFAGNGVLIEGDYFDGATSVRFNGVASSFQVTAPTQLFATVPAGATTGKISVSTRAGTVLSQSPFYVPPRVTGFSPLEGVAGSSVVIRGTSFDDVVSVEFGGAAASFVFDSPEEITAFVPVDAARGAIRVATPGGIVASADFFHPLPIVTGFSPAAGVVGETVAIDGTHLANAVAVFFGDVPSAFTGVSATQIRATVPLGAVTAAIRIVTPLGSSSSSSEFVVGRGSVLLIERGSSGEMAVSWFGNAGVLRLERAETLGSGSWVIVTNPPVVTGGTSRVSLSPGIGNAFFRLAKP